MASACLLVARLHAEEDEVGGGAGHARLQVRVGADLLRLGVEVVQGLHGLFEQRPLHLDAQEETTTSRRREQGVRGVGGGNTAPSRTARVTLQM